MMRKFAEQAGLWVALLAGIIVWVVVALLLLETTRGLLSLLDAILELAQLS